MKKRIYRLFSLVILAIAGLAVWSHFSEKRLPDELLAQIELGTKLEDVVAILGKPVSTEHYAIDYDTMGISPLQSMRNVRTKVCINVKFKSKRLFFANMVAESISQMAITDDNSSVHFWFGEHELLWIATDEQGIVFRRYRFNLRVEDSRIMTWLKGQFPAWFDK